MKPMGKREITKRGQCIDGEERACWLPVYRLSDYTVYPLFYAEWLPHLQQETVHIVTARRRKLALKTSGKIPWIN